MYIVHVFLWGPEFSFNYILNVSNPVTTSSFNIRSFYSFNVSIRYMYNTVTVLVMYVEALMKLSLASRKVTLAAHWIRTD